MKLWDGTVIMPGPPCTTCGVQPRYISATYDGEPVKGGLPVTFHMPGCPDGPIPDKNEENP